MSTRGLLILNSSYIIYCLDDKTTLDILQISISTSSHLLVLQTAVHVVNSFFSPYTVLWKTLFWFHNLKQTTPLVSHAELCFNIKKTQTITMKNGNVLMILVKE